MKWSAAVLGLAASAAADVGILKPDSPAPEGCSASFDGKFQVSVYSLGASKRDVPKGACGGEGTLIMTLKDGVLLDSKDRTGSIVANYQFQFDGPPQAGAIYTAGFSLCNNGSLALGASTVFYRCLSGDFYNLYDRSWAEQCSPIEIVATSCDAGSNTGSNGNAPKPVATSMVPNAVVTVIADGQPQLHTTVVPVPMCQIGDGQVQDKTVPCASVPPVQQIGDGQIQGHTAPPPISQIGDGQIQAPKTAAPPPPISQITDGQIQAPVQTPAPGASTPGASTPENSQAQPPTGTGAPTPATQSPDHPTSTPASPTAGAEKIFPGFAAAAAAIFFGFLL